MEDVLGSGGISHVFLSSGPDSRYGHFAHGETAASVALDRPKGSVWT
jgi:hypothetical protein